MLKIDAGLSAKFANMSFVGAVLVVCHHFSGGGAPDTLTWWLEALFGQGDLGLGGGLSWIGVPWFFLASGFFLAGHMGEVGWWRSEVLKRVRTLVVPFFFWTFAAIAFLTLMDLAQGRHPFFADWKAILKGIGFYPYSVVNPMASQLWYVRSLFLLVLASPLICRFIGIPWLLGAFAVYALCAPFDGQVVWRFWRYGFSLEGLFYFSLGVYLRRGQLPVEWLRWPWRWIELGALAVGLCLLMVHSITLLNSKPVSDYVNWVATPFLLLGVWGLMPTRPLPRLMVSAAFPIYLMHRFVFWPLHGAARSLGCGSMQGMCWWWIHLVLGVSVPIVWAALWRKFFPRSAGIVFGGR